jgi:type IV secretory pathway VirD2 relaxase
MGRRLVQVRPAAEPWLDIFSAARPGPQSRDQLAPSHVSQVARTVSRAPEVMVKVTGGATNLGAVSAHLKYISRNGVQPVETDGGESLKGRESLESLIDDWHLDLSSGQYRRARSGKAPPRSVKLVHHIVLSMPAPTPPDKVLAAARKFARERFGVEHRYAMVLHTDQRHPHTHLVVKSEGLHGRRLRIDKRTLRLWREDFAQYMREQGVPANATPRAVRGASRRKALDPMLRAQRRGASWATRQKVDEVAQQIANGSVFNEPGRAKLVETRKAVVEGWLAVAKTLDRQGETRLAADVRKFVQEMPPVMTDKEQLAYQFVQSFKERITPQKPDPARVPERTR